MPKLEGKERTNGGKLPKSIYPSEIRSDCQPASYSFEQVVFGFTFNISLARDGDEELFLSVTFGRVCFPTKVF